MSVREKRKEVLVECGQTLDSGHEHLPCKSTRRIQNSARRSKIPKNVRALANGFATAVGEESSGKYTPRPRHYREV